MRRHPRYGNAHHRAHNRRRPLRTRFSLPAGANWQTTARQQEEHTATTRTLFTNAHSHRQPGSTATEPPRSGTSSSKTTVSPPSAKASPQAPAQGDADRRGNRDLGSRSSSFCDTHLHLGVFPHTSPAPSAKGTLFEGIQRWSDTKSGFTVDEIKARPQGHGMELRHGVQYIRPTDVPTNLTSLKALHELKEGSKTLMTIQIVSFPQEGMYSYGDRTAKRRGPCGRRSGIGADCMGSIHFEQCREFGERSMHGGRAGLKYNKLIDVHCDETDDPNSRYVNCSARSPAVRASAPCHRESHVPQDRRQRVLHLTKLLKAAHISFACAPTSLYLRGQRDTFPAPRHPRVRNTNAGVNVSLGQDS